MLDVSEATARTVARANTYHLLSQILARPVDWAPGLPSAIRTQSDGGDEGLEKVALELADELEGAMTDVESLSVEHARLFVGPFEIAAPPWASIYLDHEGRLMGPSSLYAADAYAEVGLAPGDGVREAPDHVTHELQYMYFLIFQELESGSGEWRARQVRFWTEHLGVWLPRLAESIGEASRHPVYRGIGEMMLALTDLEVAELGRPGEPKIST